MTTSSKYTFELRDSANLLSDQVKADIDRCAKFAISNIARYVDWIGTVDFIVDVKPASSLTWSDADGLMPAFGQIEWDGKGWTNQTLIEITTGVDLNSSLPDAGCTLFLAKDGTPKNYGESLWFDPAPSFDVTPRIPAGKQDFIGIYIHEVFHCFGFYGATSQWQSLVQTVGTNQYFVGSKTRSLLGQNLILSPSYGDGTPSDHYGNTASSDQLIKRGLMFQWGNYNQNRLDIGRLDLAVLEDLGVRIRTYDGLPVTELDDASPNLVGAIGSERLFGDYQNNRITVSSGNEIVDGGEGTDTVVFTGSYNQYSFSKNGNFYTVTDGVGNRDGIDTLANIEFAKFSDKTVAVSDLISQSSSGEVSVSGTATNSAGKNESVVGSVQIDKFVYAAAASSYQVNYSSGRVTVKNSSNGEEDSLTNIERVRFTDKSMAFDITGNAGKAYRVYKAAFARDPQSGDMSGLGFWISRIDNGMDMVEVAARFIDSNEFRSLYGQNPSNADFLTKVYTNVLGRTPDQGGYDWWLNELNTNPSKTKSKVLADFAESGENQAGVASLIGNGIQYTEFVA